MENYQDQEIKKLIEQNKNNSIVISTHKSPDGDAIGSSLAVYHWLRNIGCSSVTMIVQDECPDFLSWMPAVEDLLIAEVDDTTKQKVSQASLIIALDYNAWHRAGEVGTWITESNAAKIVVDHHQEPQITDCLCYIDTNASSACELVYRLITAVKHQEYIDENVATCIYTGIMTDTGSFRFASTTRTTHQIVAELIAKGADNAMIHQEVFNTNRVGRLRLLGYVLNHKMDVKPEYGAALISLTSSELHRFNAQKGDTEGLVNYPLSIKGINCVVFAKEKDNAIRLSFRSKGTIAVNKIAQKYFSGGGHINAAGGISYDSMSSTKEKLIEVFEEYADEFKNKG